MEPDSVEVVLGLGQQLEKSVEAKVATTLLSYFEFEVMNDDTWAVQEKPDTSCWPACNRNMTLLTGWTVGENERTWIDGLDVNRYPNWHSNPNDAFAVLETWY